MIIFLATFLLLYGGLHVYAFFRVKAALGFSLGLPLLIFLGLMVLAPIIIHLLEAQGSDLLARILAYIAYLWMGVLFLFFSASMLFEGYRLISFTVAYFARDAALLPRLSPAIRLYVPLGMALLLGIYGFFDAQAIRVERLTISTNKLPATHPSLTIAQISDLHLGLTNREAFLEKVLNLVRNLHPDILVCTGDLVDGEVCRVERIGELLRDYHPPLGKYAITGNHEFYAGVGPVLECMQQAGFRLLRGEKIEVGGIIQITGVDDPAGRSFGFRPGTPEADLLAQGGKDSTLFTLLLKHRPSIDPPSVGRFDLQLSGHTHRGQIYPFHYLTQIFYPKLAGFFSLPQGSSLYVSRGTGNWGPPIRVFASPEITLIELISARTE